MQKKMKCGSYNGHPKMKELFLSKENYLLTDDELYEIIKEDYHERQTYKALHFVKPHLRIVYTDKNQEKNLYHQMLMDTSESKYNELLKNFSRFRIYQKDSEDNPFRSSKKGNKKNQSKLKSKNNIPKPKYNKTLNSLDLNKNKEKDKKKILIRNQTVQNIINKNNNINTIPQINNVPILRRNFSDSLDNFTLLSTFNNKKKKFLIICIKKYH